MRIGKSILVKVLIAFFSVLWSAGVSAQTGNLDTVRVYAMIDPNGDTIPYSILQHVQVITHQTREQKKY